MRGRGLLAGFPAFVALLGWRIPEEHGLIPITGEPFGWFAGILPVVEVFFLLNSAWGAAILIRRDWLDGRFWLLAPTESIRPAAWARGSHSELAQMMVKMFVHQNRPFVRRHLPEKTMRIPGTVGSASRCKFVDQSR